VSVCLALYLWTFDWRRTLRLFAPSALPPLIAHFALTWRITGTGLLAVFCASMFVGSVNAYSALSDPWQTSPWDKWLTSLR
jgi:hypothetical protein